MRFKLSKLSTILSSISFKLFIILFGTVILAFTLHGFLSARSQSRLLEEQVKNSAFRASDFIKKSLYTSMLKNERDRIHINIGVLGTEPGIEVVRIYNKKGEITFSSRDNEIGSTVNLQAEACYVCHAANQPLQKLSTPEKARIYRKDQQYRVLGLINPIENGPECSNAACHAHSSDQTILGVLDVQMSMRDLDSAVQTSRNQIVMLAVAIIGLSMVLIAIIVYFEIYVPTKKLRVGTEQLAEGDLDTAINLERHDELGLLARSFNRMTRNLKKADLELRNWSQTLEQRVEEKTTQLEEMHKGLVQVEKMASLGKMAATVAHELNNPLSGIVTFAKLLMRKMMRLLPENRDRDEVMEELELIRAESMRCGNIVKDLLIFSRESSADFHQTNLHPLIQRAAKLIRHHLELRKITLEMQLNMENDEVECDPEQIVQALVALMINGIEAMSEGGTLQISTEAIPGEPGAVALRIADNGIGMSREIQEKIFDPFFSTKNETKGVGLGLAVVYGIIQRHRGNIQVDSQQGAGTTFTITLPRNNILIEPVSPEPEFLQKD